MKNALSGNNSGYHLLAVVTIAIWSSTFISTKILLNAFSPTEILLYRFILAYACMFFAYPRVHRPESLKIELATAAAGVTGGSLYFLCENFALRYSLASNVSLLVSTAPIITAVAARFFLKEKGSTKKAVGGAVVAFFGAALVILNGKFVLKLNPKGDLLAVLAATCWAFYSIIVRCVGSKYPSQYLTRKIFFYTIITALPFFALSPDRAARAAFLEPQYVFNFLFLTVFASCVAYVAWNKVIYRLGPTRANTYIYFIPLLTLIESSIFLGERLTPFAIAGAVLIFSGVYVASKKERIK